MKLQALAWSAVLACIGMAAAAAACDSDDVSSVETTDASTPDGTADDRAPACDPAKDPSCVTGATGIFVNGATGSDSAAGTKAAPMKSITAALSKATGSKSNLHICVGTYAEHVKPTSAVNLVVAAACDSLLRSCLLRIPPRRFFGDATLTHGVSIARVSSS